ARRTAVPGIHGHAGSHPSAAGRLAGSRRARPGRQGPVLAVHHRAHPVRGDRDLRLGTPPHLTPHLGRRCSELFGGGADQIHGNRCAGIPGAMRTLLLVPGIAVVLTMAAVAVAGPVGAAPTTTRLSSSGTGLPANGFSEL